MARIGSQIACLRFYPCVWPSRERTRGIFVRTGICSNFKLFQVFATKPALCFIFRRQAAGFLIAIFGSGYNKFRIGSEKKLKMKQSVAHLFWAVLLTGLLSLSLVLGACGETATPATTATLAVTTSLPATTLSNTTAAATTTTVATTAATTAAKNQRDDHNGSYYCRIDDSCYHNGSHHNGSYYDGGYYKRDDCHYYCGWKHH